MKYPGGNATIIFCEQVGRLTALFEQWSDCEQTVVLYALMKRVPFSSLKFLQLSIDITLAQSYNSPKLTMCENNANNALFLGKMLQKYQSLGTHNNNNNCTSNNNTNANEHQKLTDSGSHTADSIYDINGCSSGMERKEDILNDFLTYLPMLKPGNDDAKAVYMSLIPLAVEDTSRQVVPTELVQQLFSYCLIHPALSSEDRRSLSHWLRHFEDHLSPSFLTQAFQTQKFFNLPPKTKSNSPSISTSSLSSASHPWQTVTPPSQLSKTQLDTGKHDWDLQNIQVTQEFCDNLSGNASKDGKIFSKAIGKNNKTSSQNIQIFDHSKPDSISSSNSQSSLDSKLHGNKTMAELLSGGSVTDSVVGSALLYDANEDHHISFSKNGTEIFDYEEIELDDDFKKRVTFENNVSEFMPNPFYSSSGFDSVLKTRRSNSLTTTMTSSVGGALHNQQKQQNECLSAENLLNLQLQKPRSFSLTMESPRSSLTSSGSETRLDDFKQMNVNKYQDLNIKLFSPTQYIGMTNIGQWLKSLRLHKYVWLFTNLNYEQMLDMTEERLQELNVTKGARHKLANCIQKLRERYGALMQLEKDLSGNKIPLSAALDIMFEIAITPMKPIGHTQTEDIAGQFMKVLDLVSSVIFRPLYQSDEDNLSKYFNTLDRVSTNDAFLGCMNQVKEYKFKLSKIKAQFTPKGIYPKSMVPTGRRPSNPKHKMPNPNELGMKTHRKSSIQFFTPPQQHYQLTPPTNQNINYNKSSSYPSFASCVASGMGVNTAAALVNAANVTAKSSSQQFMQPNNGTNSGNMFHHRHSFSNISHQAPQPLSQFVPNVRQANLPQGPAMAAQSLAAREEPQRIVEQQLSKEKEKEKQSIGDINSRLEFLCLQMTEQAIN